MDAVSERPDFAYKISIEVPFTSAEVLYMLSRSTHHYDAHCRSISGVGGFLYGMGNQRAAAPEATVSYLLDWQQLDTLVKIMEPATGPLPVYPTLRAGAMGLRDMATLVQARCQQAMTAISVEGDRLEEIRGAPSRAEALGESAKERIQDSDLHAKLREDETFAATVHDEVRKLRALILALRQMLLDRAGHTEKCTHNQMAIDWSKGRGVPPADDGHDCDCGFTALVFPNGDPREH